MTDNHPESSATHSFFHDLLERRIIQILGLYHVAFVTCLSLAPSIAILTWFHGKSSGRLGRWTPVEKIGIPANLVFTLALLMLTLRGGPADAATRTVTLTDEEGQQIEKVVPKQEFRRRVVLFGSAS